MVVSWPKSTDLFIVFSCSLDSYCIPLRTNLHCKFHQFFRYSLISSFLKTNKTTSTTILLFKSISINILCAMALRVIATANQRRIWKQIGKLIQLKLQKENCHTINKYLIVESSRTQQQLGIQTGLNTYFPLQEELWSLIQYILSSIGVSLYSKEAIVSNSVWHGKFRPRLASFHHNLFLFMHNTI